jgi:hypothetical protein
VIKLVQNFQNVNVSETEMGSKLPLSLHAGCKLDTKFRCTDDCVEVLRMGQLTL